MAFLVHKHPNTRLCKKEYPYDPKRSWRINSRRMDKCKARWVKHFTLKHYLQTMVLCLINWSPFVWKEDYNPEDQLPLDVLQIWDCFDYDIQLLKIQC